MAEHCWPASWVTSSTVGYDVEQVGRYELGGVIGVGSFATVHRAYDPHLEGRVVLKVLAENHSLNPEIRERFIAEGRSLRKVDSPHVVTVHDIGETLRQQPYLVLEHADRGTLGERVTALRAEGWTASSADVLVLARQLATALEAVHEARLVHRDLSPANILLSSRTPSVATAREPAQQSRLIQDDERVLVADLGMCKDLAVSSGLTVAGGTSGFRPPEMDTGQPAVIDTRADLWSLSSLMAWVIEDADLPPALTAALERSMSAQPGRRHPDVVAWLKDVEEALAPPPPPAPPPEAASASEETAPRRQRFWPVLSALALVLGLVGGWLLGAGQEAPSTTSTARIEIEGPAEVPAGEPVDFTLRHLGVRSWVWVLPTGAHVVDEGVVTLTPTGPGRAHIVVTARDDEGRDLRVEHAFSVRADSVDEE